MGFVQEFKAFAMKGNVIDMAVGIVIGVAFNKIVTSLVNDVIMPPIGYLISGVPFKNLEVVIKPAVLKPGTQEVLHEAVAVHYGLFINTVLEFLIVAFTVFMVVKFVNRLTRLREMISPPEPQAGPGPSSAPTPPAAP